MLEENRRTWLVAAVALAVLVVALGGYLLFRGGPQSKVTVRSIPDDLTLTLDGRPISPNGEVMVREGKHTLIAERDGFETDTRVIRVKDGDPLVLKVYLYANGPAGYQWKKDHPDQALEAEAEAGRQHDEGADRVRERYAIIEELPYIGPGFKVDYGVSKADPKSKDSIAIYVKVFSAQGKTKFLEWMQGHGYDPAKYEIIYTTG